MKRIRNHHIHYDDDQGDSMHAELRGAYERGRRDQRNTNYAPKRRSPMLFFLIGGGLIVGAWLLLGALNAQSTLPGAASIQTAPAEASERAAPADRERQARESGWTVSER